MKTIGALIFPGFELLDLFGPLEMFGMLSDDYEIRLVAQTSGPIKSGQGPKAIAYDVFSSGVKYDMILVPGGPGTRNEVDNLHVVDWIKDHSRTAEIMASVCTGASLLARAGVLDGRRATTNKAAWKWATSFGGQVNWQTHARWVHDDILWTSSGVSAGMDMSLAIIGAEHGRARALQVANWAEYHWQEDPSVDPFADIYRL